MREQTKIRGHFECENKTQAMEAWDFRIKKGGKHMATKGCCGGPKTAKAKTKKTTKKATKKTR